VDILRVQAAFNILSEISMNGSNQVDGLQCDVNLRDVEQSSQEKQYLFENKKKKRRTQTRGGREAFIPQLTHPLSVHGVDCFSCETDNTVQCEIG
jgi:hypothetical protein